MPHQPMLAAAPAPTPEAPARWIIDLGAEAGYTLRLGIAPLGPTTALSLDPTTAVALAADLLRDGWQARVRLRPEVAVDATGVHRSFELVRRTRLGTASGETWILTGGILTTLATEYTWERVAPRLSAFAAAILDEEVAHG